MLFSSTIVSTGNAIAIVSYTGMNTAIGSVHAEVQAAKEEEEDTPLKQKIDQFGDLLAKIIAIICLIVWVINYGHFSDPIHGGTFKGCIYYFKIAVALAVAAIPEGLPAVITTCLALGTRKMSDNNCIVRRLPSVETLGCTSTICSDKTGTLTKNEMSAIRFGVIGNQASEVHEYDVQETSYSPEGKIEGGFSEDDFKKRVNAKYMALVCSINNRATIDYRDKGYKIVGEPTEGALKVLAEKFGRYDPRNASAADRESPMRYANYLNDTFNHVATLDFSSERKTMSTVINELDGKQGNQVLLKGAPERVIDRCDKVMLQDGSEVAFTAELKETMNKKVLKVASQGFRVLGVGISLDGGNMKHITKANRNTELADTKQYAHFENGNSFLGYVCIKDPVRPEVKAAIKECKTAGINVIMITGDSKETAISIAQELDIIEEGQNLKKSCFTGSEFEALTNTGKVNALMAKGGKVFSRVEPRHKRELVKILIEQGEIVAMTGDGVNDAPALKQAHIGVAMGITGTEVAKQASDMVLADDNFATIVKAVEEGRSIYSNMKAFIRYLISSNIGEVLSIFFTAMLGIPEGFNSVQLLWVNLVTDGPPATALGFNPADPDVMRRPPRKADDALVSGWVFIRYMVVGIYVGLATVGIFVYWYVAAETGDGHTLITMDQLMHWSECPSWEGFQVNNFIEGVDFSQNPCDYFVKGKVKASTLSLSVLVVIEMLNALNAISEDASLFEVSPFVNIYLLGAIANSILLHAIIVYVPFLNEIFSISSLNQQEWILIMAFSSPVLLVDEILKVIGRAKLRAEIDARLKEEKKN